MEHSLDDAFTVPTKLVSSTNNGHRREHRRKKKPLSVPTNLSRYGIIDDKSEDAGNIDRILTASDEDIGQLLFDATAAAVAVVPDSDAAGQPAEGSSVGGAGLRNCSADMRVNMIPTPSIKASKTPPITALPTIAGTPLRAARIPPVAAPLMIDTSQDDRTSDGTTSIMLIINELLNQADLCITDGLHPRIIIVYDEFDQKKNHTACFSAATMNN
ncbi:hypothetical protein AND_004655 [Anopheles darlingi]|uniref:Uncharacterized protein n=1 Tax=Anopheles darlingi TaxID=43151 RepID=W5JHP4_ANODA|nr:hypothetical protein AND_004655 [Anopheles darlingi]